MACLCRPIIDQLVGATNSNVGRVAALEDPPSAEAQVRGRIRGAITPATPLRCRPRTRVLRRPARCQRPGRRHRALPPDLPPARARHLQRPPGALLPGDRGEVGCSWRALLCRFLFCLPPIKPEEGLVGCCLAPRVINGHGYTWAHFVPPPSHLGCGASANLLIPLCATEVRADPSAAPRPHCARAAPSTPPLPGMCTA
jgi:hypothetical protein